MPTKEQKAGRQSIDEQKLGSVIFVTFASAVVQFVAQTVPFSFAVFYGMCFLIFQIVSNSRRRARRRSTFHAGHNPNGAPDLSQPSSAAQNNRFSQSQDGAHLRTIRETSLEGSHWSSRVHQ